MKKAKIILSAAGILSVIAGAFAFKVQHKYLGTYFCTGIYSATTKFATKYTTAFQNVTLYCTQGSAATARTTFLIGVDA